MTQLLQGKLHQAMTLVNPIFGLPTPHQQSVKRILSGAQLIRLNRALLNSDYCLDGARVYSRLVLSGQSK